jgi:hypothetical protein
MPGLHFSNTLMWWDMPGHPMACPLCGKPQVWWLNVERFRVRRTAPDTEPPPGWGYVSCGYCAGLLVLVLRPWPGLPNPPYLQELQAMMLRHSSVQYRLEDDVNSREPRWRSAMVTKQRPGGALDLQVTLHSTDPEHRDLMLKAARTVQFRLADLDGVERWRTALVADVPHPDGSLDLTVHYSQADQLLSGRAFERIAGVIEGDGVGQWRHSSLSFTVSMRVERSRRGTDIGCWLPVDS